MAGDLFRGEFVCIEHERLGAFTPAAGMVGTGEVELMTDAPLDRKCRRVDPFAYCDRSLYIAELETR